MTAQPAQGGDVEEASVASDEDVLAVARRIAERDRDLLERLAE